MYFCTVLTTQLRMYSVLAFVKIYMQCYFYEFSDCSLSLNESCAIVLTDSETRPVVFGCPFCPAMRNSKVRFLSFCKCLMLSSGSSFNPNLP